ncbi:MAG: hypothetical protein H0V89_12850, partial [Deltaproteobacteria bacterium]|nr:hypothetical protein [Deltaproteobacteria bacterium]
MRLNLLSAGFLLAFAGCDGKSGGEDTDEPADTEPDESTGGTGTPPEETGPWDVFAFDYYFQFHVDENGAVGAVNGADGTPLEPIFVVTIYSQDGFYDGNGEECEIVLDLSDATLSGSPDAGMYASWDFATTPVVGDTCTGVSGTFYGANPVDVYAVAVIHIAIGPPDTTTPYFDDYYADLAGGFLNDGLFTDPYDAE